MDDTVNRLAKELAQAIRAAVAADPTVEACRAKARAAGYELHLSIDAEVGFANRAKGTAMVKVRRAGAGSINASGPVQPASPPGPLGFAQGLNAPGSPAGLPGQGSGSVAPLRVPMREL